MIEVAYSFLFTNLMYPCSFLFLKDEGNCVPVSRHCCIAIYSSISDLCFPFIYIYSKEFPEIPNTALTVQFIHQAAAFFLQAIRYEYLGENCSSGIPRSLDDGWN